MKTIKKLLIAIIIALGLLTITMVYAEEEMNLYAEDVGELENRFEPFNHGGGLFFCIEYKAKFSANIEAGEAIEGKLSPGSKECEQTVQKPWHGNKRSMSYEQTEQINMSEHQDAAYALAILKEHGISWTSRMAQEILWKLSINEGAAFGNSTITWDFNNSAEAEENFKIVMQDKINDIQTLVKGTNEAYPAEYIELKDQVKGMEELKKLVYEGKTDEDGKKLSSIKLSEIIGQLRRKMYECYDKHEITDENKRRNIIESLDRYIGSLEEVERVLEAGYADIEISGSIDTNMNPSQNANISQDEIVAEAKLYDKFYRSIHQVPNGSLTGQTEEPVDQYTQKLKNKTDMNNIHKMVNREEGYYVVGPFKISYPQGKVGNVNKFSWISDVMVLDQNGTQIASTKKSTLEIIDKAGGKILDTDKDGNWQNVPKDNQEFYIKFNSREALEISLKINFGYLESCSATGYRYEGNFVNWYWKATAAEECKHKRWSNSQQAYVDANDTKFNYELQSSPGGPVQVLFKLMGEVEKNYIESLDTSANSGKAQLLIGPIDLTMDIEGKVWLDEYRGKGNTTNSTYDKGEDLQGVDVWLYENGGSLVGLRLTDGNGHYEFKKLNAQKEYYVQFVYNGMLYTNVDYRETGANNSKATETAHGHGSNRTDFNNQFKEIGSYPENYTTTDCITGATIKNRVFEQGDLVNLFKEVAKAMVNNGGNEKAAYQSVINAHSGDSQIRQKVQYIADCRIKAYTVTNYARYNQFIIENRPYQVGGINYKEIYEEQRYVNLGIKARPTVDLTLYKDVLTADIVINGKTETYKYDARKSKGNPFEFGVRDTDYKDGFVVGTSEDEYQSSVRNAYLRSRNYDNTKSTREMETDTYDLDLRSEEVANAQKTEYNVPLINQLGVQTTDAGINNVNNPNYQLNNNYDSLKYNGPENVNNNRLKIFVTYKISIRNQTTTASAVTEIVDYFDKDFAFVDAYVGNKDGTQKIGEVTKYDTSMYGNNTQYMSNNGTYKTIYLRPNNETRLVDGTENAEQYIFVTLQLLGTSEQNDAGKVLSNKLLNNQKMEFVNIAEINGYKTYNNTNPADQSTPGLVDIDSNPGNLNINNIGQLTTDNIKNYPNIEDMYEDDTSRAPAIIAGIQQSRTIEGTVFEDANTIGDGIGTAQVREGNGQLENGETGIAGVIVQLVEIKDGQMIERATTRTNNNGWYGFTGFVPGNYTIRYIYGSDDQTGMTTASRFIGLNQKSYNGQEYQSTKFGQKQGDDLEDKAYLTDQNLINRYQDNFNNKAEDESVVQLLANTTVKKYKEGNNYYWYTQNDNLSDAHDDEYRRALVINYSKSEYNTEIANYKADVFNSYLELDKQPEYIKNNEEYHRKLADELERRTYRYSYTPEIVVEVEKAVTSTTGNKKGENAYEHKITGIDFGIVERPKSKIELTKNVDAYKVVASDGTVLYDTNRGMLEGLKLIKQQRYETRPPIQITMDNELLNGATIQIKYKFTVTNNSELGEDGNSVISAKNIIDFVDNDLTFNPEDNAGLWESVSPESVQNITKSTLINNSLGIDLSTIQTILKTTEDNPLTQNLQVGETVEGELVLRKVLATESDTENMTYDNIAEIVEVKQIVGRYDKTSTPGDQNPEDENKQDDSYRAETITIVPPYGETTQNTTIYYIIGFVALAILGIGIFLIKKFVIKKQ